MKNSTLEWAKAIALSVIGGIIAAANLNMLIEAGNLVPGGFSGLAVLCVRIGKEYFNINLTYGILYMLFNIPGAFMVFNHVGRKFTVVSLINVVTVSLFTSIIPHYHVTEDILLICVFGGIIQGLAYSIVLASGGCGGGTDFIAIYLAKKYQKSMWNAIFFFNSAMYLLSGYLFGWEIALYSIIYQYVQTQVLDMFDKRYKRSCFVIITDKPHEIAQEVYSRLNHSVTKFEGVGFYSHQTKQVLYTVIGKYEEQQFISIILSIDPKAFVNVMDSERIIGNFNQKPF